VALWLFKEEPTHYSFADLERDGEAVWDGIGNALALKHLRQCKPGDRVFYYHTGNERAVVGEMEVVRGSKPGAKDVAVTVRPVRRLQHPVSLARIKSRKEFEDWELVRISRLSIMPVTRGQWKLVEALSRQAE
jgi:predicted RNA-binding protein with PUA-like domain